MAFIWAPEGGSQVAADSTRQPKIVIAELDFVLRDESSGKGPQYTLSPSDRLTLLSRLHHLPLLFGQQVSQVHELTGALELLTAVHDDLLSVHVA